MLVFQKPAAGAPPSPTAPRVPPTHPAPTSQLPLDAAGGSRSPDLAISRSHWGTQFCASCVREVQTSRFHGNVVWEQGNQWMLFSQINLVSLLRLQAPLSSLVFSHSASSAASPICLLPPGTCARGASPAGMWGAPRGAGLRLRPLVGHIESMAKYAPPRSCDVRLGPCLCGVWGTRRPPALSPSSPREGSVRWAGV